MESIPETVEGAVEATAQNSEDRYGVRLGGEWFDGKGECPVARGERVKMVFMRTGRFNRILGVRREAPGPEKKGEADRRITRAVALKAAAAISASGDSATVLRLAEQFEEWLNATPSPCGGIFYTCRNQKVSLKNRPNLERS